MSRCSLTGRVPADLKLSRLNINVGLLGHVDSGKTCLSRALSTTFSTASMDKSTESRKRGMTLDLGFSAFELSVDEIRSKYLISSPMESTSLALPESVESVQFTLVDCPGHASLIRTVIGGASIMDVMVLVIDVMKGIQAQTGECIVLGQVLCQSNTRLIVALNKMDAFYQHYQSESEESLKNKLDKRIKNLRKAFSKTKFGKHVPIIPISANIGGVRAPGMDMEYDRNVEETHHHSNQSGIDDLMSSLISLSIQEPLNRIIRDFSSPFLGAVDHCFNIVGHGSVLTCTVLKGCIQIGDCIQVLPTELTKKVKSLQMFSKPVTRAIPGDRVAVSITQFGDKSKSYERGFICKPDSVKSIHRGIARIDRIEFFKDEIKTGDRFHISIGHCTTVAKLTLFRKPTDQERCLHSTSAFLIDLKQKQSKKNMDDASSVTDPSTTRMSDDTMVKSEEEAKQSALSISDPKTITSKKKKKKKRSKKKNGDCHCCRISATDWNSPFDFNEEYLYMDELEHWQDYYNEMDYETYALLEFSKPIYVPSNGLIIGSRLDKEALMREDKCRMAFAGRILTDDLLNESKEAMLVTMDTLHSAKEMCPLRYLPMNIQQLYTKMQMGVSIEAVLKRQSKHRSSITTAAAGKKSKPKKRKEMSVDLGLQSLMIYKAKSKEDGNVIRVVDSRTLIGDGLFGHSASVARLIDRCRGIWIELRVPDLVLLSKKTEKKKPKHKDQAQSEEEAKSGTADADAAAAAVVGGLDDSSHNKHEMDGYTTRFGRVNGASGESGRFFVFFAEGHSLPIPAKKDPLEMIAALRGRGRSRGAGISGKGGRGRGKGRGRGGSSSSSSSQSKAVIKQSAKLIEQSTLILKTRRFVFQKFDGIIQ